MNQTWKEKWLEALRSGKYEQWHLTLRKNDLSDGKYKYCCLGVLCDIYPSGEWIEEGSHYGGCYKYGNNKNANLIPDRLASFLGLSMNTMHTLARMNDGEGRDGKQVEPASFKQIADWIEKNV